MGHSHKRESIMKVAEKLFSDRRLHEITLDDIARRAHVGKGTIYNYFHDKDDLFFQVATSGFDELCDLLAQRVSRNAPFPKQLLQACEAITAFFRRRRYLFRMIQTEDARMSLNRGRLHAQWLSKRAKLTETLGKILEEGRQAGVLRTDLPTEALARFLLGLLRTRGRELQEDGHTVSDGSLVDMFLHGAAHRTAAPGSAGRDATDVSKAQT